MKRFLIVLITMICLSNIAVSQNSATRQSLSDCEASCFRHERLGANGNIFVYQVIYQDVSVHIYEIDASSGNITDYNIGDYFNPSGELLDLAVLDNYKVITAESLVTGFRLILLDLQANSAIELSHNIEGILRPCGRITGARYYSPRNIFRYDNNHVLLCTGESNGKAYINLVRIENNNLVFEERFPFGSYGEVPTYPASWHSVLSGLDGRFYVVPRANSSLLDFLPFEDVESLGGDTFAVMAYEPLSQAWSGTVVDLPLSRPELITDRNFRYLEFIAVDELGNMYFHEEIGFVASSFIKVRLDGQRAWELTEADLGGFFDSVVISDSNHATIFFRDNSFLPLDLTEIAENT